MSSHSFDLTYLKSTPSFVADSSEVKCHLQTSQSERVLLREPR